jgi:transposase
MDKQTAEKLYDSGKQLTVDKLIAQDAEINTLKARIAALSKTSTNSSKPPSSDIVKAPKAKSSGKRKKGGQKGHPRWERKPFPESEVQLIIHPLKCCPICTEPLKLMKRKPPQVLQQVEMSETVINKYENRAPAYWCAKCKQVHYAEFPESIRKEGLFKAHLSATVCFLKYAGSMSFSAIVKYLADAFGILVTKGYLVKVIAKGSKSLGGCYNELLSTLPKEKVVNADETGHKENGNKYWTWVFRTSLYALFKIDLSRGSDVLIAVLGKEFDGILGCDYFSAYRKYMRTFSIIIQFCLAHLIRDVKFLLEYPEKEVSCYGEILLDALRKLFKIIHKRELMNEAAFQAALEKQRKEIIQVAVNHVPKSKVAQNMARRFIKHGDSYFTFITSPEVDPTNNGSEQAIRFVVQYRHVSQGTRSPKGRIACERFWTIVASCALQGRSAFEFIKKSFEAYFNNTNPPSLNSSG